MSTPSEQEVREYLTKALMKRLPNRMIGRIRSLRNSKDIELVVKATKEAVTETEDHFDIEFAFTHPDTLEAALRVSTKRGEHHAQD